MEVSVIVKVLNQFKLDDKLANIVKKNGYFFNGKIMLVDSKHVQIDDRKLGPSVIAISEISEVRESLIGGIEDG